MKCLLMLFSMGIFNLCAGLDLLCPHGCGQAGQDYQIPYITWKFKQCLKEIGLYKKEIFLPENMPEIPDLNSCYLGREYADYPIDGEIYWDCETMYDQSGYDDEDLTYYGFYYSKKPAQHEKINLYFDFGSFNEYLKAFSTLEDDLLFIHDSRLQYHQEYISVLQKDIHRIDSGEFGTSRRIKENFLRKIQHKENEIKRIDQELAKAQNTVYKCQGEIEQVYQDIYAFCIKNHGFIGSFYQRGLLNYNNGNFFEFLDDIYQILNKIEDSKILFLKGQSEIELGLYHDAILTLSNLIRKDPTQKQAYFERALCYFERGNFNLALEDYLNSDIHNHALSKNEISHIDFASGFIKGASNACTHALQDFVPSMLTSLNGLSHGIWSLVTEPLEVSKEFVNACQNMAHFLKENSTLEAIQLLIPEVQELVQNWDQLTVSRKGELMGQAIGHHGTDFLLLAGVGKGLKTYQELRKANAALTLEKMARDAEKFQKLSEIHEAWWKQTVPIIEELKQNKRRFDKELSLVFKNEHLTENQIRKILHTTGYKTFPRPKGIPTNCKVEISKRNGGMIYIKAGTTEKQNILVRVMPGNPTSPNPMQQKPYVIQRRGKNAISKMGNEINWNTPEAHIPLSEYKFNEW